MNIETDGIILILYCILAFVLAFFPAYFIFPRFIRKMKSLGNTGKDVNKRGNIQVAESGGIVAVFSFSLAMFIISGLASITNFALTDIIRAKFARRRPSKWAAESPMPMRT